MGNTRMYQALNDYGNRLDTVGIFTFEVAITVRSAKPARVFLRLHHTGQSATYQVDVDHYESRYGQHIHSFAEQYKRS